MNRFLRAALSLLLAALMLVGTMTACSSGGETVDTETTGASDPATETDRFADVDFGGRTFSIYTSIYDYSNGMGNSNFLIQGEEGAVGNYLNEAVLERNQVTEELLGIKLAFTQADLSYNQVAATVRKLVVSGTHTYDLIINDLFPLATLSLEGSFLNLYAEDTAFDFDQPYWYASFMEDAQMIRGYGYILAGDYTVDVLRSAHCLLFNKQMYAENTGRDASELYDFVDRYEWTYEKMNEVITDMYFDKNGTEKRDAGDRYGYLGCTYWGETIAFAVSAAPGFVARDENGDVRIALTETQRASDLAAALTTLLHNDSTSIEMTDYTLLLEKFVEGEGLFVGNQRLGSLENPLLRNRTNEIGVLPYPMLYASDRCYNTAAHDTTEIGVIPQTEPDPDFAATVIEVLCRETASRLIPKYYTEALQIQYVDDARTSEMIAIIHDNIRESFALAYNNALGSQMLNTFSEAAQSRREFSALYEKREKTLRTSLEKQIRAFAAKVGA